MFASLRSHSEVRPIYVTDSSFVGQFIGFAMKSLAAIVFIVLVSFVSWHNGYNYRLEIDAPVIEQLQSGHIHCTEPY
jgi:hypothetical protein